VLQKRAETTAVYNSAAELYDASIGQIENYDQTYNYFINSLPKKCSVLDLACGSGAISRKIQKARPLVKITGVDLSSGMLAIARNTVADGTFIEADICSWKTTQTFDGVVLGFGLPYLDDAECVRMISRLSKWISGGGGFYASFMQGVGEGYEKVSFSPDSPLYLHYHDESKITNAMIQAGIIPEKIWHLDYIESDGSTTTDVVVIGRKR
jgi:SAM-dependent methyltransferase